MVLVRWALRHWSRTVSYTHLVVPAGAAVSAFLLLVQPAAEIIIANTKPNETNFFTFIFVPHPFIFHNCFFILNGLPLNPGQASLPQVPETSFQHQYPLFPHTPEWFCHSNGRRSVRKLPGSRRNDDNKPVYDPD